MTTSVHGVSESFVVSKDSGEPVSVADILYRAEEGEVLSIKGDVLTLTLSFTFPTEQAEAKGEMEAFIDRVVDTDSPVSFAYKSPGESFVFH